MRIITIILLSLIVFGCNEFGDHEAGRLVRIEAWSYTGYVLHTQYGYDKQGRITTITQYKDNEEPVVIVSITYNGNEAVLLSSTEFNQNTKVVLTLTGSGLTQRRIEYTHKVSTTNDVLPSETFVYDTLVFEYDVLGFLTKTKGSRYDSTSWVNLARNQVRRVTTDGTYTVDSGNITASEDFIVYRVVTREENTSNLSGGSSERHSVFNYTKSYPNKTDFSNAAILNEYKQYHEAFLNINYLHMPDQVISTTIDRDLNDEVFFYIEVTRDMERVYNGNGLLSSVRIPEHTQYTEVNYFYQ